MGDQRKYYEAYDDRYRQVHKEDLRWFAATHSPILSETLDEFAVPSTARLLEIGCGEGRDAVYLLQRGYDVLATDISAEAIDYCKRNHPQYADSFRVLDCIEGELEGEFDFIYAVAVIHMLVRDEDREAFYRFVREHLTPSGMALICTMGDGRSERQSDLSTAFELQERVHEESGRTVYIAGTSCRVVNFDTFISELNKSGLSVVKWGTTAIEPDFPQMMYAVVKCA